MRSLATRIIAQRGRRAGRGSEQDLDPSRRVFLSRCFAGAAVAGAGTTGGLATRSALEGVQIKAVEVSLSRLPAACSGIRIVQLTDLHIGPTLGRRWLEGIVERVNGLKADLVVVTGDLVDGTVAMLRYEVAPLKKLRSRLGTFFVTGNHEYFSGAKAWLVELEQMGLRVLKNERVSIEHGGASFDLAGIHDQSAMGRPQGLRPDLARALEGRDPRRELVLLAHQPKAIDDAVAHGVGLQLSGHTHGGQIWPWHYAVSLQQPYLKGLHRRGETQIYVSEGTGFWGPPMRLGSTAEIALITLRSKQTG